MFHGAGQKAIRLDGHSGKHCDAPRGGGAAFIALKAAETPL